MSPPAVQPPAALTIRADMWDARRASGWLESAALAQNVPLEQVVRLDHCLDEALANVIRHGGPTALSSPVHLQFCVRRGPGACTAELSVSDAGVAFDPSTFVAVTPHPASLVDATPGGLGLLLIRNFSDELSYRHSQDRNHITITVRWVEAGTTRATPDWLVELRNARGAGVDAIALFRGAEPSAIVEAITDCEIRIVPVGATLLQPGQSNDTIYVLLAGQLAAYLDATRRQETGIPIQPGESVGEMSAIDGKPVSAFVVAVTESRLLLLPGKLFWSRLGNVPGVMRNMLASFSERMRRGNEAMLEAQRKQLALEHMRRELQIARQLQTAMIPLRGRLFPERADIEIAGIMDPASDVGGDFFDAFFADERHLFLCVGDVSGHGIPAALFMARAIGLIRIAAMGTRHPEKLLERINDQLCARNAANIFVTLFCAVLDVVSGRLVYANGGHCPPFLAHEGRASSLPMPKGALVGVTPGLRYAANEVRLDQGVALVCFTDGVTEAESAAGQAFSEERLLRVSAANCGQAVDDLLRSVQRELATFLDGVPLADDCTLVAVRRPVRSELR